MNGWSRKGGIIRGGGAENGPFVRLIDLRLQHLRTIGAAKRGYLIILAYAPVEAIIAPGLRYL